MSIFHVLSLLGGLAMFLYGMRLMGDSLKENSSGTLKRVMERVTNNPVRAFVLGMLVTALIQSSTATIVITSGLVGAGILTLTQSLGIIVGANVGTTVTGQIIRLLDLDTTGGAEWLRFLQPSTLAPVALILGMVLIMSSGGKHNTKSIGNIAVGFGILFSGLLNMTSAVNVLRESGLVEQMFTGLDSNPVLGYLTGAGVAFVLQSSSATIGILQAFSATGLMTWKGIYAVIVGIYLGDCVTTAIVCSIGAQPEAKRVGIVNILFNLSETVLVLLAVTILHKVGLLDGLWDTTVNSGIIANTNTIFNLCCAITLLPMVSTYERLSRRIVKDVPVPEGPYKSKLDALNPVFFTTPALALRSCYDLLMTMFFIARSNIDKSFKLLFAYDEKIHEEILADETELDTMTDRLNRYIVELLPHLQLENHIRIVNQYYKVSSDFERLGDHAVNIAQLSADLVKNDTSFSKKMETELDILKDLIAQIMDLSQAAFQRQNLDAATKIEPNVRVAAELIDQLKRQHLRRMINGECNVMADPFFTNLMVECKRITDVCSNVGVATVVRFRPELADHEHRYYDSLMTSGDATFDETYDKSYSTYIGLMEELSGGNDKADSVNNATDNPTIAAVNPSIAVGNILRTSETEDDSLDDDEDDE